MYSTFITGLENVKKKKHNGLSIIGGFYPFFLLENNMKNNCPYKIQFFSVLIVYLNNHILYKSPFLISPLLQELRDHFKIQFIR